MKSKNVHFHFSQNPKYTIFQLGDKLNLSIYRTLRIVFPTNIFKEFISLLTYIYLMWKFSGGIMIILKNKNFFFQSYFNKKVIVHLFNFFFCLDCIYIQIYIYLVLQNHWEECTKIRIPFNHQEGSPIISLLPIIQYNYYFYRGQLLKILGGTGFV